MAMEDRISSLPDQVIFHILSFLPTKIAATTSILSKRWNPLWLSLLTLKFDGNTFHSFNSLRNSVSTVFLSRDITLPVLSFHLKCPIASARDSDDINRFVYAAAQRKVQNLNLELSLQVKLPPSIFSCRTLVALHLKDIFKVNDLSHIVVDFPLLKTLHLCFVLFESIDNLLMLLFGCPILEELHAEYLSLNLQDLSLGHKAIKKRYPVLPNLIRASITSSSFYSKHAITIICWPKVQVLRVELDSQLCSRYSKSDNVTCMELILKLNHCDKWLWSLEMLKHCPKLQNLTINEKYWNNVKKVVDNWTDSAIVPECLSTQLRTCLFEDYKYTEGGLQFAKYIMQNSKVMNTLSIRSASSVSENVKHQMVKKLASWTRASTTCKLLID